VASATAGNDFRYLTSSGLKAPPPTVIFTPYISGRFVRIP
jgi:hypothetical protein